MFCRQRLRLRVTQVWTFCCFVIVWNIYIYIHISRTLCPFFSTKKNQIKIIKNRNRNPVKIVFVIYIWVYDSRRLCRITMCAVQCPQREKTTFTLLSYPLCSSNVRQKRPFFNLCTFGKNPNRMLFFHSRKTRKMAHDYKQSNVFKR